LRPDEGVVARAPQIKYMKAIREGTMVRTTGVIFAVLALGLLVAGCDRCGDWYSPFENPFKSTPHACHDGGGQPQH
jgi:hypothetical protein